MIYVISDLHLSLSTDKPMDVFGAHWIGHFDKIKRDWQERVTDEDLVLIGGDTSWAMSLEEADRDLLAIDALPGRKIIIKGNHDYWWSSLNKMQGLYPSIDFLHNNFYVHKEIAICGSRGWLCPNDATFSEHDEKIYRREAQRLELSLAAAKKEGFHRIITMLHYPPTNDKMEPSLFTELIERYEVETVIYGHLHTEKAFKMGYKGCWKETMVYLTACDYLDFRLLSLEDGGTLCKKG